MSNAWELRSTTQCSNCPWLKHSDPFSIQNNYSIEKHLKLKETITDDIPVMEQLKKLHTKEPFKIMACHKYHDTHCLGWIYNQIGTQGNNIRLRMQMSLCSNANKIKLAGEQHLTFEETLRCGSSHDGKN